jgi:hypothetical protein
VCVTSSQKAIFVGIGSAYLGFAQNKAFNFAAWNYAISSFRVLLEETISSLGKTA